MFIIFCHFNNINLKNYFYFQIFYEKLDNKMNFIKNSNNNNQTTNKFLKLRMVLKLEILEYICFDELIINVMIINKQFFELIKKNKTLIIITKNQNILSTINLNEKL